MDTARMRTWAEISLDSIEHNYRAMRARLPEGTRFLGVVKANAYGHGAVPVARTLQELGCDYLAVACLPEAVELREAGVSLPLLILGVTPPELTSELVTYGITQAVGDIALARALSAGAAESGGRVMAHLKLDTGMGRLGFMCRGGSIPEGEITEALSLPGLDFSGVFTHFAVSDTDGGGEYTERQFSEFTGAVKKIEALWGHSFKIRHCTNSGAMVNYGETYLDMVRPGIALYGCYPGSEAAGLSLEPAMALKTRIVAIKEYDAGETISYGRTFTAKGKTRIAVLPIGYADGLHRALSNKLEVLVRGVRAPQTGRICMDMCMADVTGIPDAAVGDVVTIFGRDGDAAVTADELAELAGTISYELLCAVSPRVPRIYLRNGSALGASDI